MLEGSLFYGRVQGRIKEGRERENEGRRRKEGKREEKLFQVGKKSLTPFPGTFCFVSKQGRARSSWSRVLCF